MKRTLSPFLLLALGACAAPGQPPVSPFEAGKAHLMADKPHRALVSFRAAADLEGRSIRVLNALGASYDAMGRPDMAETYYREALSMAPRDPQTLNNMGWSLLLAGRTEEAGAMLRLAFDAAPDDPVVARNLGLAEARLAEIPAAALEPAAEPTAEPGPPPAPERFTPKPPLRLGPWIERSARGVVTLRTDLAAFRQAVELDAPPELAVPAEPLVAPRPQPADCPLEIANGNGRTGAAAGMGRTLSGHGMVVARLTNASTFTIAHTEISFAPGCEDAAKAVAIRLPAGARLIPIARPGTRPGIRLVLGHDINRTRGI